MGAATGGADPLDGGVPREAGAATESCRAEEPVPGPSGLGQMRGLATQREAPRSPAPDGERDVCMEPEPQGPLTKGAQWRALLAEALLRRGASFRHLRPLSLPWQGSKGAAPEAAEGELAEEKEEEPKVPGETGEAPTAEGMDEDAGEGEGLPPEDEEMNPLRVAVQAEGDEQSGWAHVRGLDKSKSSHLPPGCLMYPARIPPIETTASGRGRWELGRPTRAVSTARLANRSRGERTLPDAHPPTPNRVLPGRTRRGSS